MPIQTMPDPLAVSRINHAAPTPVNGRSRQASIGRGAAFLVALLLLNARAYTQTLSLDWSTISGGGGTSTGRTFAVSGTIGQPGVNPQALTGGAFSVVGGFWSVFAVQTPGAPLLAVTRNPQIPGVTVSWPSPSTGFILQETANLNQPDWTTVLQAVTDNGTIKFITINNPPVGNRFYRLFKP